MSTKTLRKRIALVAVSALGFALLSAAPSSAAASTSITATGIARAGVGMQLTVTGNDATDTSYVHYTKTGTLPTGGAFATSGTSVALVAGVKKIEIADDGSGNIFVAGTYNLLVWINSTSTTQTSPAVGDVSTRVAITVAGVPTAVALTAPTAAVSAGTAVNAKFVATLTDANGVNTFLVSDETVTVRATYTVGAVEINEAIGSGTEESLVTATTTALSSGNATGSGATGFVNNWTFYLDNSLATSTTVAVAGAGLLTGITGASATLTTVAKTFPTLAHVNGGAAYSDTSITAGNGLTSGAYVQATDASSGSVAITASTADAKSITFQLTGTAADSFDYTIAATSTTVALPTGITAGTYTTSAIATGETTVDFTITATAAAAASGYKVTIPVSTTANLVYTITYEAPVVGGSYGTVTMSPGAVSAKALIGSTVAVTATVKDQFGKAFAGANVVWSGSGYNTIAASNATSDASGKSTLTYTDAKTTGGAQAFSAVATAPTQTSGVTGTTTITFGTAATVAVNTLTVTSNKASATTGNLVDAVITETATVKDANGAVIQGIPVTMSISENGYAVSTTLSTWTNSSGQVVMQFAGKTVGTATVTVTAGDKSATDAIVVITSTAKSRTITLSDAAVAVTGGDTKKITATVRDGYGNLVSGQTLNVSLIGTAGRVSAVNGVIAASGTTGTDGTLVVDLSAALTEAGTATLTVAGTMGITSTTATLNSDGVTALPALAKSATTTATITASTAAALAAAATAADAAAANKAVLDAVAAIAAKAASDKAESDAKIKLLEAQIAAAAVKAAADTAAAQAAAVAAAEAAADAAAEAIDAGNNAYDSANAATDAADAATAAAQQAGEDAVAAAEAAGAAAVEAAQSAQDAAAEATDAATAATDAANAAAEAADAATAAAQDAADAVAALSVQVTEVVASLKKQITALTNLVIRIQKKVKA